jgi:hypothetical protein
MLLYSSYMSDIGLKWRCLFFLSTLFCFDPHIQFPIQLVETWTIHHAQGLSMDNLAFDPHGVFWHGLTYTTLIRIRTKGNLYLFNPLQQQKFNVDVMAKEELSLSILKNVQFLYLIIQSLNTWSLNQYYHDILANPNLQASHILCPNETQLKFMESKWIVALTNHKFSILPCYDGHGTIMFYDANNTLHTHETYQKNCIEIIVTTFNINIKRTIHVVISKSPTTHIQSFFQLLENIYIKALYHCLTIFIGDFNVEMLKNITSSKQLTYICINIILFWPF